MAQLASAPALGAGGPPFESEYPDKKVVRKSNLFCFIKFLYQLKGSICSFRLNVKSRLFCIFRVTGTKRAARAFRRSSSSLLCAACLRICKLRCPALRKDLCKPEDKERYIPNTSELRSERFYFCIEGLCRRIG